MVRQTTKSIALKEFSVQKSCATFPKANARSFDEKSEQGFFVGYSDFTKAYRVYSPETHNIFYSRDVIFVDEDLTGHGGIKASGESLNKSQSTNVVSLEFVPAIREPVEPVIDNNESEMNLSNFTMTTADEYDTDLDSDFLSDLLDTSISEDLFHFGIYSSTSSTSSSHQDDQLNTLRRSVRISNQQPVNYAETTSSSNSEDCFMVYNVD